MIDEALSVTALVKDGKAMLSELQESLVQKKYQESEGKFVRLTVKVARHTRSERQNSYLWGIVYKYIADYTGDTTEDTHEAMKYLFLPRQFTKFQGKDVPVEKSTTRLSTKEFEEYLDRVRSWAASELNVVIPLPNEEA